MVPDFKSQKDPRRVPRAEFTLDPVGFCENPEGTSSARRRVPKTEGFGGGNEGSTCHVENIGSRAIGNIGYVPCFKILDLRSFKM